jgi:hypothetical protein
MNSPRTDDRRALIRYLSRRWILLFALCALACRTDAPLLHPQPLPPLEGIRPPPARAFRMQRSRDRIGGPLVTGQLGDFRIDNGRVAVVITGLTSDQPGALVDAARTLPSTLGEDTLHSLTPLAGAGTPRQPRYARIDLQHEEGTASLRLSGSDAEDDRLSVVTEYSLQPGASSLRITTTVINRGKRSVLQYQLADAIDWGASVPFAPGIGRSPKGQPALRWIAASSEKSTYAYYRRGGILAADFSRPISRVGLESLDLPPGQRVSVERFFSVGRPNGSIAALLPEILEAQGTPAGAVEVLVEDEEGYPVPDADIEVRQHAKPFTVARTVGEGLASFFLPHGAFSLLASTTDRRGKSTWLEVLPDRRARPIHLRLGPPSRLVYEVRERGKNERFPFKLTLLGLEDTPTPSFGPDSERAAQHTILSPTGQGSLALPPGRYQVIASRGPEFTLQSEVVTLPPWSGGSFVARLARVVETQGYLGVDLGQLTRSSPGCAVLPMTRVLSNLVEGVGAAVSADSERVVALPVTKGPRPRSDPHEFLSIPGLSLALPDLGQVTVFPLPPSTRPPNIVTIDQLVEAGGGILQLDSARQARIGLFWQRAYDPKAPDPTFVPPAVSALRLLDGQHPEDFDRLLEDWLSLLRAGRRITATAASASRAVFGGEAGYPRTYVEVPRISPTPALERQRQIVEALRGGRAIVSSGPFLRITVEGRGPGATIPLAKLGGSTRGARSRKVGDRAVEVRVVVSAPSWIALDRLVLYLHGKPWGDPVPIPGRADGVRLEKTLHIPVGRDTFLVGVVRGSSSLEPVVHSPSAPLPPLAVSNPIWIDFDGDGEISLPDGR